MLNKIRLSFFFLLLSSSLLLIAVKVYTNSRSEDLIKASMFFPIYLAQELPDINLVDESGNSISRDDISDGIVILHFWATWCKSCEQELYSISKIEAKDIKFFCISIDENSEAAVDFIKQRGLNLDLYFDKGGKSARLLGSFKFPETYVLVNGKIVMKFEGPRNWEDSDLMEFIHHSARSAVARWSTH